MKRISVCILAAAAIVACQKAETGDIGREQNQEQEQEQEQPQLQKTVIELVATVPATGRAASSETKTSYEAGDGLVETLWTAGDAVGIWWYRGGVDEAGEGETDREENGRLVAKASGKTTSFEMNGYYLAESGTEYPTYACYPYSVDAGTDPTAVNFTLPTAQTQSEADDMSHISATDLLYASTIAKNDGTGRVNLSFDHVLSVLSISLTTWESGVSVSRLRASFDNDADEIFSVTEGTVNLSDGSLALTSGSPEISLYLATASEVSTTATAFNMSITPGHAGKRLYVYATLNGTEIMIGTKKIPDTGIPAGVRAKASFTVSARGVVFDDFEDIDDVTGSCFKMGTYSGALSVVDNPLASGLNTSGKVLRVEATGTASTSGYFTLDNSKLAEKGIEITDYKGIRASVYQAKGLYYPVMELVASGKTTKYLSNPLPSFSGEWEVLEYDIDFSKMGTNPLQPRPFQILDDSGKPVNIPKGEATETNPRVMYYDSFILYK